MKTTLATTSSSIILLVGGLLAGLCTAQQNYTCTAESVRFTPEPSFILHWMVQKIWYVQEIFVPEAQYLFEPEVECMVQYVGQLFESNFFGFTHNFIEVSTSIENGTRLERAASCGWEGESSAVWLYVRSITPGEFDMTTITHTDEDQETYLVMHWCPLEDEMFPSERVYVLTGIPNPDEALLSDLTGKVAAMGFPVEYGVQISHHANCTYENGAMTK